MCSTHIGTYFVALPYYESANVRRAPRLTSNVSLLQNSRSLPGRLKVLLTKVSPPPQTEGQQLRASLKEAGIPLFKSEIPLVGAYRKASAEGITARGVTATAMPRTFSGEFALRRLPALAAAPGGPFNISHNAEFAPQRGSVYKTWLPECAASKLPLQAVICPLSL